MLGRLEESERDGKKVDGIWKRDVAKITDIS